MNLQSLALALLLLVAPAHSALLDDVKARVSVKDTLRGEFRQEKRIAKLSKPLLASGQFVYLKQQSLLWQIEKPYASDSIITADTLIQSVNGKTIVRVDAKSQPAYSAVSRIFMALVAGDWAALEADFVITGYVDGQRWQLTLKPKAGLFASFANTLTLTGASALQQIDIAEKNGDSTHYTLSQVRAAGALSAAEQNQFLRQ
ncbi:outer membrane lipoprotein carrier protein LolA [Deefgea piscis]|uniref:outer membrane lipoprotein carrier protein LolA n=1 Tax=Deefgea piscis TaxID=2739061 RepID=UPI001C7E80C7|nr:outer membrane lipoprotein carrier protein LolA [Deefgea piscis]QZA82535.1 outer membrane lipoprotein carrier protein LolA [Deefgea piscis]